MGERYIEFESKRRRGRKGKERGETGSNTNVDRRRASFFWGMSTIYKEAESGEQKSTNQCREGATRRRRVSWAREGALPAPHTQSTHHNKERTQHRRPSFFLFRLQCCAVEPTERRRSIYMHISFFRFTILQSETTATSSTAPFPASVLQEALQRHHPPRQQQPQRGPPDQPQHKGQGHPGLQRR